jgi:unsaturated rhamnogalacturonyl hydrolase
MTVVLDPDQNRVLQALLAMQRHSWEQGVASHACLDLGLTELAAVMAADAVTRQRDWGGLGEMGDDGVMNGPANGEAVLAVDDRAALDRQLDWLLAVAPRAQDGTLFHMRGSREVWADTVYMTVPLLGLTGHLDLAKAQLDGHRRRLHDPSSGLYAARWDEDAGRLNAPQHWGTGSGWVVAGIARAISHVGLEPLGPEAAHAREVIDACLPLRCGSGLFHDVVDDPATFEEANLGQMLAYAIFRGIRDGWLPETYRDAAHSLLATAREHIGPYGVISPVCGAPTFDRPGHSAEAQAFFLLASAAARKLS